MSVTKALVRSTFAVAAALIAMVAGTAQAGPVRSTFIPGVVNEAFDFDIEYLLDRTFSTPGAPGFGIKGQVDPGDALRGIVDLKRANSVVPNLGAGSANNEWTGVFQAKVDSVVCGGGFCSYVFVPDPAFEAIYGAGAMIAFYDDAANNVAFQFGDPGAPPCPPGDDPALGCTVPPSSADVSVGPYLVEELFVSTATGGSLMWVLGIDPTNPDTSWTATTTAVLGNNVLGAFAATSGTFAGFANIFLDVLSTGPAGVPVAPITCAPTIDVDFCMSVTLGGVSNLSTPFEASSQARLNFKPVAVPEPGSLALFGIAFVGLGAMSRRRRI